MRAIDFSALAFAAGAMVFAQTFAHEAPSGWRYDWECCHDRDCARIEARHVREVRGGWSVAVPPGAHPLVPPGSPSVTATILHSATRPSGDGEFHLCLSPVDRRVLCFYVPPGGV